nr:uncharacterized protein LOC112004088 [Quercus suber]
MDEKLVGIISAQEPVSWKVYVDGAANHRGSRVGQVLIFSEKITIEKSLRLDFSATNNEAEYEALLVGMAMVQKMGGKVVEMVLDLRLVVGQVQGELEARDPRMKEYLNQVRSGFKSFIFSQVPRNKNTHADSMATLATSSAQSLPRVILIEDLYKPTEAKGAVVHIHQIRVGPSWMDPIVLFLKEDILPEDKFEAEKFRRKALRGHTGADLYHIGPIRKATSGRRCRKKHRTMQRGVTNARGPFPKAVGNKRYLLVSTDYFTKWVEAEPLANIRDVNAKRFIWKNIVTRFGVPHTLISDNRLQFDSKAFKRYCCDLGIKNRYSTSAYPRGNGQAEAINKVIEKRPFSMTYRAEAVIPLETGFPTLRISSFTLSSNDELLGRSLDLVEERRENAMVQSAYCQHKLKQGYVANVKLRLLTVGDLVLRNVLGIAKNTAWGKLGPN